MRNFKKFLITDINDLCGSYLNMLISLMEKFLNKIRKDKKLNKIDKHILSSYFKEYKLWVVSISN